MDRLSRIAVAAVVIPLFAVLLAAIVQQTALAAGWMATTRTPPWGGRLVLWSVLGMVAAGVLVPVVILLATASGGDRWRRPTALVATVIVVLVFGLALAGALRPDSYYLPQTVRIIDNGGPTAKLLWVLGGLTVLGVLAAWRRPYLGLGLAVLTLWFGAAVVAAPGGGH